MMPRRIKSPKNQVTITIPASNFNDLRHRVLSSIGYITSDYRREDLRIQCLCRANIHRDRFSFKDIDFYASLAPDLKSFVRISFVAPSSPSRNTLVMIDSQPSTKSSLSAVSRASVQACIALVLLKGKRRSFEDVKFEKCTNLPCRQMQLHPGEYNDDVRSVVISKKFDFYCCIVTSAM
jgi:hypothetical protein